MMRALAPLQRVRLDLWIDFVIALALGLWCM